MKIISEFDCRYHDHVSTAIYLKFALHPVPAIAAIRARFSDGGGDGAISALVWTTTPWTIPSNRALAINPDLDYCLAELTFPGFSRPEVCVVAAGTLDDVVATTGCVVGTVEPVTSDAVLSSTYEPAWRLSDGTTPPRQPIISADYVTDDSGTGVVHTAPQHGLEDFQSCERHGVPMNGVLVNADGRFVDGVGHGCDGLPVLDDGNAAAIAWLESDGAIVHTAPYEHRYPYDWRTRKPVILRATAQWFADLSGVTDVATAKLEDVHMVPTSGRNRLAAMLQSRTDWCISRQRSWGVPIPVFYDAATGEHLLTDESFAHVLGLVREHGSDCWFALETDALLPPSVRGGDREWVRGHDTMDVWFDSGSSWRSVIETREGAGIVADLYLEGSDQHRGWFQSSLLTSVAGRSIGAGWERSAVAPYKTVVTHGFVVDESGKKMSKSLGNGVDPAEVINGGKDKKAAPAYGADVLRLWVANSNFTNDVGIGPGALAATFEQLRKVRNSGRFLLGNLADFDPAEDTVPHAELGDIDRFVLHRIVAMTSELEEGYEAYNNIAACQGLSTFVTSYLMGFVFEIYKDRLYLDAARSQRRRAAQTVLYAALQAIKKGVAPIACHLAEELHAFEAGVDPANAGAAEISGSVMQTGWIDPPSAWHDPALSERWEVIRSVRQAVFKVIEEARQTGTVGGIADAKVSINAAGRVHTLLNDLHTRRPGKGCTSELEDVLMCSEIVLHCTDDMRSADLGLELREIAAGEHTVAIGVEPAVHHKCPRCWRFIAPANDVLCARCEHVVAAL